MSLKTSSIRYLAAALTFRKSIRAIELYSKPVNLGLNMVASAFQNSGAMAASVSVKNSLRFVVQLGALRASDSLAA